MLKKIVTLVFLLIISFGEVNSEENIPDLLSIEDTLKIIESDISLFWHYREPWLGNPDARNDIYDIINLRPQNITNYIAYVGLLGDSSDVEKLWSLFSQLKEEDNSIDINIIFGVYTALALLSNRGIDIAGDKLEEMTSIQFWEEMALIPNQTTKAPFYDLAWYALNAYPFAGRDDFEDVLTAFLQNIEEPKRREGLKKQMHSRYESVVKREKEIGTWKVQGKPETLPKKHLPINENFLQQANKQQQELELNAKELHKKNEKMIEELFSESTEILANEIRSTDGHKLAKEILEKIKRKEKSTKTYKEIVYLGFFPEIVKADDILEYMNALPKNLDDEGRQLLVASIFSLGLLSWSGDVLAQNIMQKMTFPKYWVDKGFNIYDGMQVQETFLTSENALACSAFLIHDYWLFLMLNKSTSQDASKNYLDSIKMQGTQREILLDIINNDMQQYIYESNP